MMKLILSFLISSCAFAVTSPSAFYYEGVLYDTSTSLPYNLSGVPIYYEISANSCVIWSETANDGSTTGQIYHMVGSGSSSLNSGNFSGVMTSTSGTLSGSACSANYSDARSLVVRIPSLSITSTIPIQSVPYALQATTATTAQNVAGIVMPANGGTGLSTSSAGAGQLLIGNGSGFSLSNLTAGTGIAISNSSGSITVSATGGVGPAGSQILTGSGIPSGGLGVVNDFYLNTTNGNYYLKTGASTWTLQANLTGPAGPAGATGPTGATGPSGASPFSLNGSDAYYTAGRVGIGVTTPAAKLEVNGPSGATLKIMDGNQASGKVLTSDSAGQASWQSVSTGGFAGTVNISSPSYTVSNSQNGIYFTYNGSSAGIINLPSLSLISDGFQITIARQVAQSLTLTPSGADSFPSGTTTFELQGQNIASVTIVKLGSKWNVVNKTDDCTAGQSCWATNQIYVATLAGHQYFTTPGGCTNSATPTCSGSTDAVMKSWANSTGTSASAVTTASASFTYGGTQSASLAALYTDTDAAKFCESMIYAGYSDWYLPSVQELNLLYQNSATIGGFWYGNNYWSSTETGPSNSWVIHASFGGVNFLAKTSLAAVRCVRRF